VHHVPGQQRSGTAASYTYYIAHMNFNSKKLSLAISGITALICSRGMFFFINDPEGPNVLVVVVAAAIIFFLSWAAYRYLPLPKQDSLKKLLIMIVIQIVTTAGLYFFLK
jgi:hypothetical protein